MNLCTDSIERNGYGNTHSGYDVPHMTPHNTHMVIKVAVPKGIPCSDVTINGQPAENELTHTSEMKKKNFSTSWFHMTLNGSKRIEMQ